LGGPRFFVKILAETLFRLPMAFWPQNLAQGKGPPGIEEVRARYASLFARLGAGPAAMDFTPGQLGPIHGEWVGALGNGPGRTLLYFHGGGFIAGSPETHRPLVGRLVEASGVGAFSVKYRLAPECSFPSAVRDGIDAYRALLGKGVRGSSIILAGDEAGGGLAFAVALAVRNANLEMPGGIVALSPWADLSLSGLSMLSNRKSDTQLDWETLFLSARHYLRKSNPCDAYASPAYADLHDFPPLMVHAGAGEILRDDASKLGDRAAEAQVPVSVEIYDGMGHLFQADTARNEAKVSLSRLAQFIRAKSSALAA
jgi:monoterpene epsilon-lactone hydrolase